MIIIDDISNLKPSFEIHQPISIPDNPIDLRSDPRIVNQFYEPNSTVTTLNTPSDNKIEQLNSRKELLLKKRDNIFNSLLFRFFNINIDKINIIDNELDKIEEEIYYLRKPQFQKEVLLAKNLIKKTSRNISKYKSEIDKIL